MIDFHQIDVSAFHSNRWNGLSGEERLAAVNKLADDVIRAYGRKGDPSKGIPNYVLVNQLDAGKTESGCYDPNYKSISIHPQDLQGENSGSAVLHTMMHELRHAYQDDTSDANPRAIPSAKDRDQLDQWRMNMFSGAYISSKEGPYYNYYNQPIENDANNFADNAMKAFESQLGDDPAYRNFMGNLDNVRAYHADAIQKQFGPTHGDMLKKFVQERAINAAQQRLQDANKKSIAHSHELQLATARRQQAEAILNTPEAQQNAQLAAQRAAVGAVALDAAHNRVQAQLAFNQAATKGEQELHNATTRLYACKEAEQKANAAFDRCLQAEKKAAQAKDAFDQAKNIEQAARQTLTSWQNERQEALAAKQWVMDTANRLNAKRAMQGQGVPAPTMYAPIAQNGQNQPYTSGPNQLYGANGVQAQTRQGGQGPQPQSPTGQEHGRQNQPYAGEPNQLYSANGVYAQTRQGGQGPQPQSPSGQEYGGQSQPYASEPNQLYGANGAQAQTRQGGQGPQPQSPSGQEHGGPEKSNHNVGNKTQNDVLPAHQKERTPAGENHPSIRDQLDQIRQRKSDGQSGEGQSNASAQNGTMPQGRNEPNRQNGQSRSDYQAEPNAGGKIKQSASPSYQGESRQQAQDGQGQRTNNPERESVAGRMGQIRQERNADPHAGGKIKQSASPSHQDEPTPQAQGGHGRSVRPGGRTR